MVLLPSYKMIWVLTRGSVSSYHGTSWKSITRNLLGALPRVSKEINPPYSVSRSVQAAAITLLNSSAKGMVRPEQHPFPVPVLKPINPLVERLKVLYVLPKKVKANPSGNPVNMQSSQLTIWFANGPSSGSNGMMLADAAALEKEPAPKVWDDRPAGPRLARLPSLSAGSVRMPAA